MGEDAHLEAAYEERWESDIDYAEREYRRELLDEDDEEFENEEEILEALKHI